MSLNLTTNYSLLSSTKVEKIGLAKLIADNLTGVLNSTTTTKSITKKSNKILFPDFIYDDFFYETNNNNNTKSNLVYDLLPNQDDYDTRNLLGIIEGSGANSSSFDSDNNDYSFYGNRDDFYTSSMNYSSFFVSQNFFNQMSTPFFYIIFMFIVYIFIITVIFMSTIYSHRKKVGYELEDLDDEEASAYEEDDKTRRILNRVWLGTTTDAMSNENELENVKIIDETSDLEDKESQTIQELCDSSYSNSEGDDSDLILRSKQKNHRNMIVNGNISFIENAIKSLFTSSNHNEIESDDTIQSACFNRRNSNEDKNVTYNKNDMTERLQHAYDQTSSVVQPLLNGSFYDEENL